MNSKKVSVGLHLSVQARPGDSSEAAVADALEDVRIAERLGFSSALFAEHHFIEDGWVPQALTLAAAAAAVTKRIRVGSDILILPLQHPVAVAEQAVLVDLVSRGRCVLGVGAGWRPEDFSGFGLPFDTRFRALTDGLRMLGGLLSGDEVTIEGPTHSCERARLRLTPVQKGGVPLWVGATGPQGIRRAARLADAWILSPQVRVQKLKEGRDLFEQTRAEAGRAPATDVPLRREAFVAETDDQAWDLFEAGIRHQYGKVYASRHPDFPSSGGKRELRRWAADLMVVGSIQTVTEEFLRLHERLGVTEVLVRPRLPGVEPAVARHALELFGEVVSELGRAQATVADG